MSERDTQLSSATTVQPQSVPVQQAPELDPPDADQRPSDAVLPDKQQIVAKSDSVESSDAQTGNHVGWRKLFVALLCLVLAGFVLFWEVTARAVRYDLSVDPGRGNPLRRPYEEWPVRIWRAFLDGVYPLGGQTTSLVIVIGAITVFVVGAFTLTWLAVVPSEHAWSESLAENDSPTEAHT